MVETYLNQISEKHLSASYGKALGRFSEYFHCGK